MTVPYTLAVHGGAGTIARGQSDAAPYHAGLRAALAAGEVVLAQGGSALDAVVAAVRALEDEPLFNAGRGAVYTSAAQHEMDAAVMDGATLSAGAVAGVRTLRNPVQLARAVMDSTFVLLSGEGAEQFARDHGFEAMPPGYFHTDHRLAQLHQVQNAAGAAMQMDHAAPLDETRKFGTVGAVALDSAGHLASAVSTGGMTNKHPGRIGDSPLVGAGIYANDQSCAVSATGSGEYFIRACVAHDIHARMAYAGATLEAASRAALAEVGRLGGEGGVIAVDRQGHIALPYISAGMYRGWVRAGEAAQTRIFEN
ncbi:isoaspartyl peptidase/L-asparaginase family protein [Rhodoferax sp. WC2427]|uniref:isoaspartyl peptidase/L-asparaginase family protein n=1 Tax=Rhodoferax sp. WC2427 TaxID=3234144 RepID=UPI0034673558